MEFLSGCWAVSTDYKLHMVCSWALCQTDFTASINMWSNNAHLIIALIFYCTEKQSLASSSMVNSPSAKSLAFFLWYEVQSTYNHILLSSVRHRCFTGPFKLEIETTENIFYIFMLKCEHTLLASLRQKDRSAISMCPLCALLVIYLFQRHFEWKSNKYSFCCYLSKFNTSFLRYNCTSLSSLKNLFLLKWRIYYFKWDCFKINYFESFLCIYFNTACSISYDGEVCMTKIIFRGLSNTFCFMYIYTYGYVCVDICAYIYPHICWILLSK